MLAYNKTQYTFSLVKIVLDIPFRKTFYYQNNLKFTDNVSTGKKWFRKAQLGVLILGSSQFSLLFTLINYIHQGKNSLKHSVRKWFLLDQIFSLDFEASFGNAAHEV